MRPCIKWYFFAIPFALIVLVVGWILWMYRFDYRLTSLAAATVNPNVGSTAKVFYQHNYGWGIVYLFNTPNGPRTVLTEKRGLLWHYIMCTVMGNSTNAVQTVSWVSFGDNQHNHHVTVLAVETTDPHVAYIEAGPTSKRLRKAIPVGEPIVFSWDDTLLNNVDPVAYSQSGQELYQYRYPKNTNSIKTTDLEWYPVGGDK